MILINWFKPRKIYLYKTLLFFIGFFSIYLAKIEIEIFIVVKVKIKVKKKKLKYLI